jgi:hypothetical protein
LTDLKRLVQPVTRGGGVEERRGCLGHAATLRFLSPLIEPDMQISSIRLSDKTSRLRPRFVVAKPAQTYEPEVPVQVREWIGPALVSPDFVLVSRSTYFDGLSIVNVRCETPAITVSRVRT